MYFESSSSECGDYSKCMCCQQDNPYPFYPTVGQPMRCDNRPIIYYSSLQHSQQQDGEIPREVTRKKRNQTCFARAYQWYTQERKAKNLAKKRKANVFPPQAQDIRPNNEQPHDDQAESGQTNVAGFADWLDLKYEEFLKDHEGYRNTRISETNEDLTVDTKRKRRRCCTCSADQGGDLSECENAHHHVGCKYILPPKDMPAPDSDYCNVPESSSCHRSYTTLVSVETRSMCKITESIPLSCNTLTFEKPPIDKERVPAHPKNMNEVRAIESGLKNESIKTKENPQMYPESKLIAESDIPKMASLKDKQLSQVGERCDCLAKTGVYKSIKCQCPDDREILHYPRLTQGVVGADAAMASNEPRQTELSEEVTKVTDFQSYSPCICTDLQRGDAGPCRPRSTDLKDADSFIVKNFKTLTKTKHSCTIFVSEVAQTSNHSITLCKETTQYPMFVRIVCADKLTSI